MLFNIAAHHKNAVQTSLSGPSAEAQLMSNLRYSGVGGGASTGEAAAEPAVPFSSFSACLIIKDENIILPEWLAYHYTVLPLHRLIVGVDPESQNDPTHILGSWAAKTEMDITVWKNDSFWKDGDWIFLKKGFVIPDDMVNETLKYELLRNRYLHRQRVFYEACLTQLRQENKTWTVIIDADEYLMVP